MARLYIDSFSICFLVSQLEGGLHSFIVAVVDIAAAAEHRGFDSHNLEVVGLGPHAVLEVALSPE